MITWRDGVKGRTGIGVDLELLTDELNLGLGVVDDGRETLLYRLYLLRDGRQNALLKPVKLVKAAPCADLTEADKDAPHRLKVERLVAAENKDEAAELGAERLDRLGLACATEAQGSWLSAMKLACGGKLNWHSPVPAGPKGEPPS